MSGVCCCEGRGSDPAPGAEWAYLTFTGNGARLEPAATPQQCVVPGNRKAATGAVNVPMIYWSDWVRYRTNAPSGRPQMLFRVLATPQQLSMTVVAGQGDFGDMIPGLRPWLLQLGQIPGDFVTDPRRASHGMHKSQSAPLMVVQYESVVSGVQIVIGGDSQLGPVAHVRPAGGDCAVNAGASCLGVGHRLGGGSRAIHFGRALMPESIWVDRRYA